MTMSNQEIARSYCEAKNKTKQIGILAELNCSTKKEIRQTLRSMGINVPDPGPKPKVPEPMEDEMDIAEEKETLEVLENILEAGVPDFVRDSVVYRVNIMDTEIEGHKAALEALTRKRDSMMEWIDSLTLSTGGDRWLI